MVLANLNVLLFDYIRLYHPSRSLCYPPHHPFRSGWQHLQQSLWSLLRSWVLTLKELKNRFHFIYILSTMLTNLSVPDDVHFP